MLGDQLGNGARAGVEIKDHLSAGLTDILSHLLIEQFGPVRIVLEKRKRRDRKAKAGKLLFKLRFAEEYLRSLVFHRIRNRIGDRMEQPL